MYGVQEYKSNSQRNHSQRRIFDKDISAEDIVLSLLCSFVKINLKWKCFLSSSINYLLNWKNVL